MANKIAQRLRLLREKRLASQKERKFSLLKWFGLRRTSGFLLLAAFIALRVIVAAAVFGALYLLLAITQTLFATVATSVGVFGVVVQSLG